MPVRVVVASSRWRAAAGGAGAAGDRTGRVLAAAAGTVARAALHAQVRVRWGRRVDVTELAVSRDLGVAAAVTRTGVTDLSGTRLADHVLVTVTGADGFAELVLAAVPGHLRQRPAAAPAPVEAAVVLDVRAWGPGRPDVVVDTWVQDRWGWSRTAPGFAGGGAAGSENLPGWEPVDGRDLVLLVTGLLVGATVSGAAVPGAAAGGREGG